MDLEIACHIGTRLSHMAKKLTCNEPLVNVAVPRQCLGRGSTVAAGYRSVGPIRKYQGRWKPPAGYMPYVPKYKSDYGHHLFVMPNNEVHGRVGQIQFGAQGLGKHMSER